MILSNRIIQRHGMMFPALLITLIVTVSHIYANAEWSRLGHGKAKERGGVNSTGDNEKSDFGKKKLNDFEEERTYRKDNVVISVKKLYAGERLNWNFEVTVENENDIKKTVEGAICLFNMYIQPRECGAEECRVNMAVMPKSIQTKRFTCRGKMDMNSWAFLIFKVHNF